MNKIQSKTAVRGSALVVALAGALGLAACSSSGSSGSTPPPSSPTGTASAPATPTETVTTTATTATVVPGQSGAPGNSDTGRASSGSGGSDYCAESQLRATVAASAPNLTGKDSQGRQERGFSVDFINKSGTSCVLYGYPGVATENSSNAIQKNATRALRGPLGGLPGSESSPQRVRLAPGQTARALIEGVDQQEQGAAQAGCDATTPRMLITPPNTRTAVPFTVKWGVCYSLSVHPVRAA